MLLLCRAVWRSTPCRKMWATEVGAFKRACISGEQRQMLSSNMSFSMASKKTLTALKRAVITTSRVVSGVTKGLPAQGNTQALNTHA